MLLGRVVTAIWCALAAATFGEILIIQYAAGGGRMPMGDEWMFVDPTQYLPRLFERHNDHPYAIGRLFLAADYYLADASGDLTRFIASALGLIEAGSLVVLAWMLGLRERMTLLALFAVFVVAIFNPLGEWNYSVGFQAGFVLVFALAPLCFIALAHYAEHPSATLFLLVIGLAFAATQSQAVGVFAPALMIILAWRARRRWRMIAALAVILALDVGLLVWSPTDRILGPGDAANQFVRPGFNPVGVVWFVVNNAGSDVVSALAGVASAARAPVDLSSLSAPFGALVLGAAAYFFVRMTRGTQLTNVQAAAILLVVFAILSIAVLAIGRSTGLSGGRNAFANRYVAFSALLLCSLVLLAADQMRAMESQLRWRWLGLAALLSVVVPLFGAIFIERQIDTRPVTLTRMQSSLVMRADEPPVPWITLPGYREASERARVLGKWHFADPWAHRLGVVVGVSQSVGECGRVRALSRSENARFRFVEGEAARSATRRARSVVAVDEHGVMVGYGRALREARDLWPFDQTPAAWAAFAPTSTLRNSQLSFYLADRREIICQVGGRGRRPA